MWINLWEDCRKTTKPVAYSASGICKISALNFDDISRGRDQRIVMALTPKKAWFQLYAERHQLLVKMKIVGTLNGS